AGLCGANSGARPLDDRRVHSHLAVKSKRSDRRCAGAGTSRDHREEIMSGWDTQLTSELEPTVRKSSAIGGAALLLCLVGAFVDRQQFFRSYLIAYVFWLGIPLGCLAI